MSRKSKKRLWGVGFVMTLGGLVLTQIPWFLAGPGIFYPEKAWVNIPLRVEKITGLIGLALFGIGVLLTLIAQLVFPLLEERRKSM